MCSPAFKSKRALVRPELGIQSSKYRCQTGEHTPVLPYAIRSSSHAALSISLLPLRDSTRHKLREHFLIHIF